MPPTGVTGPIKPFIKRKTTDKVNRPTKKPKMVPLTIEEMPPATQLPPSPCHKTGKGLMTAKGPVTKKCPPFSTKIRDTSLVNCRTSLRTTIMRTWVIMQ